ncbi:glucokinase [Chryseobacterium sp. Leaf404]|uniref:glucokinase n=1 Tax=unclassified Chryseobacterium TaxID=2593645 RepID=UPI0006FCBC01|nr:MULTISPECIES: glucokinase [unclassified Chryseobacterium]KQT15075.1 glucokinase [Chryseobacterium sp. Leaf404]
MNLNPKFPLYLPGVKNTRNENLSILGTNLREDETVVAYYVSGRDGLDVKIQKKYITKDYPTLNSIISAFLAENSLTEVDRFGISVPGPVLNGKSNPDRLGWNLDSEDFKNEFGFKEVCMLNDQEAAAYGIGLLEDSELEDIRLGGHLENGNVAVIAPGNGLGEAGYFFDGKYLRPFATEGGHSEFSPRTTIEVEFYQFLNNLYGIVSWENVLSKAGLFNIYRFLRDVKRHPEPEGLSERLNEGDFVEELYRAATEENVMICKIAIDTFLEFLAREANSLTLKLKATGGLILAGDIPQILSSYMDKDKFYEKFKISDKMEAMLQNIPIYLVKSTSTSINGVALYTAYHQD